MTASFLATASWLRDAIDGFWDKGVTELPSEAFCNGAGRLLGEFFASEIAAHMSAVTEDRLRHLTRLSVLLRAIVVLRDWQTDNHGTLRSRIACQEAEVVLVNRAIDECKDWHDAGDSIFLKFYDEMCAAPPAPVWSADAIRRRCALAFVPIHLVERSESLQLANLTASIDRYLLVLQIIDDIEDIDADCQLSNANFFTHCGVDNPSLDAVLSTLAMADRSMEGLRFCGVGRAFVSHGRKYIRGRAVAVRALAPPVRRGHEKLLLTSSIVSVDAFHARRAK